MTDPSVYFCSNKKDISIHKFWISRFLCVLYWVRTMNWDGLISHLISSQSLNLGGRRGTTDDVATIPFHPSLSYAALRESPNPIPVHSLMLSSHLFFCLPLLLAPFTVPCRLSSPCQRVLRCGHTIWVSVSLPWLEDHHALQLHSGFCCEPLGSSHGLCRKCSEVSYSISSQGLGSFSLFLLSRSSSHRHKGR